MPVAVADNRDIEEACDTQDNREGPFGGHDIVNKQALIQLGKDTDPSLLPMLIEDFVKNTEKRCAAICDALESMSSDELEQQAHALGSSAATFGAERLKLTLRALEAACIDNDQATIDELSPHVLPVTTMTLNQIKHVADDLKEA